MGPIILTSWICRLVPGSSSGNSRLRFPLAAMPSSKPKQRTIILLKARGSMRAIVKMLNPACLQTLYSAFLDDKQFLEGRMAAIAKEAGIGPQKLERSRARGRATHLEYMISWTYCKELLYPFESFEFVMRFLSTSASSTFGEHPSTRWRQESYLMW